MKSLSLVSLAFAVGSLATALEPRAISNNNCGRAVAGTANGAAYLSTARRDCSTNVIAYTTITITPSASTFTLVSNIQATASATSVVTNTGSVTGTSTILSTETDQYLSTAYSTSTEVDTLTIVENSIPPASTVTIVSTVSSATVSTTTSYYATVTPVGAAGATVVPRAIQERDEQPTGSEDNEEDDREIEVRGVASSTGTIPAYAAACTNFAQYVLACSLLSVSQATSTISSTLSASTFTVTAFSTLTTTLLETSSTELDLSFTTFETLVSTTTQTSTVVIPTATTSILTVYTTEIASASTISVYTTTTVSAPATVSTISVPVPTFKVEMAPASGTGTTFYLVIVGSALGYTGTTDINAATAFTLDTAGRLVTTADSPVIACAYNTLSNYYMEAIPYAYLDAHAQYFTALSCGLSGGLVLSCAYKTAHSFVYVASQNSFFYSVPGYNGYPTYIANAIVQ